MIFLQMSLHLFIILSLLSTPTSTTKPVSRLSLWGNVADFTSGCSHLTLKPEIDIPALHEVTACFNLQFQEEWDDSPWTAFMYRHPEFQYSELGFGGKMGLLVVYLFGEEWSSSHKLTVAQWYSLCLTWSHTQDGPALYVDGKQVDLTPLLSVSSPIPPLPCQLAPNGSLTLGMGHKINDGNIEVIPGFTLPGKLSLFRMWGREFGREEVAVPNCAEGDLVKWDKDHWDARTCAPIKDSSLQCKWSSYEVRLMFAILRHDKNNTELDTAKEIAHKWLREVLPSSFYLHKVSVFEVTRSDTQDLGEASHEVGLKIWANPNANRFHCLVHVSVFPSADVAAVQVKVHEALLATYKDPSSVLDLLANPESIYTTPVEGFSPATSGPPTTVTEPCTVITSTSNPPSSTTTTTIKAPTTSIHTTISTDVTSPDDISDLYFEVRANVSITGDGDPQQTISTWLNSSLPDDIMMVLNLQLLPKAARHRRDVNLSCSIPDEASVCRVSRESCIFQVHVMKPLSDTEGIEEEIRELLLMPFDDGSVSIVTENVEISRIYILMCDAEVRQTRKGLFVWDETAGGKTVTHKCPKNQSRYATRQCQLCLSTHWMEPDLEDCPPVVETITDLEHLKVTPDNALDVLVMIMDLLSNRSALNSLELVTVLSKLEDIIHLSVITTFLGQRLINIISDILESDSDLIPFTNTILNITESVGDRMVGYDDFSTLVAPGIAISVVDVVPGDFKNLSFGVSSDWAGSNPEIYINKYPYNHTVAFISLPSALQHSFPHEGLDSTPRVQFQFHGIPLLFKNNFKGPFLNTFVVSASVTNASFPIKDLAEEVQVKLYHLIPNTLKREVHCVFWNFNKNGGHGGWDDRGCRKHNSTSDYTTCLCDHLTHFGVLLDVSRTPLDPLHERILTMITYVGCGVSSLFLGITVLTYTAFDKLRRDYPSQILINLSLALLGLNLVFLMNSWLSSWGLNGLCVAVASMLHYFLLASFTWMGLEAVNMYFALVKVFNVYVPSYILKFCVLGWGLPLVICLLVLIVDREAYGSNLYTDARSTSLDNSDQFCWLQDDVTFYVSVVAYAVLIFLFNIGIFVVVLIQIRHMRANSPAGIRSGLMHDLKGVASLTLLLGLTWSAGFFTWGPGRIVLLYLFAALNSLHGLFIFLFHCLMRENVRKQWRIHLCFGRFRLDEYSEWSNSGSVGVQAKPRANPPRPSRPSVRSIKSSSTDSTSASSDSSQRDSTCRRPNLGLFVNSLALPRAQRSPSGMEAVPSYRGGNPTPGWRNQLLDQQEQR